MNSSEKGIPISLGGMREGEYHGRLNSGDTEAQRGHGVVG